MKAVLLVCLFVAFCVITSAGRIQQTQRLRSAMQEHEEWLKNWDDTHQWVLSRKSSR